MMPGSPLARLAGEEAGNMSAQDRARIIQDAGLDNPLGEQYLIYLGNLFRGDFGYSFQQKKPITSILLERLPWTLLLTGTALVLSTLIGATLGALAAWRRGQRTDFASISVFIFLQSLPSFWVGMILVAVFAVQLELFPTFGARDVFSRPEGLDYLVDVGHHLVLPAATLVLFTVSEIFLTMRYSMLSVLGEDFVTVARAKGLNQQQVLFRHAVRNAVLPVATVFMLRLGEAFAGATVIETVFSYPGVGRLIYDAVLARDYPLLQGAFLLITLSVVAANLVADLLYPILDPRVARRA
jgi:peptide/nickel transport system permease protein